MKEMLPMFNRLTLYPNFGLKVNGIQIDHNDRRFLSYFEIEVVVTLDNVKYCVSKRPTLVQVAKTLDLQTNKLVWGREFLLMPADEQEIARMEKLQYRSTGVKFTR